MSAHETNDKEAIRNGAKNENESGPKFENESGPKFENENGTKFENENGAKFENENGAKFENENGAKFENENDVKLQKENDAKLEKENSAKLERDKIEKRKKHKDDLINEYIKGESSKMAKYNYKVGLIDWTSGTLGGVAETYCVQPFDTIKVKRQTYPFIYRNSLDCFLKTYRYDGLINGIYAGTKPALVCNILENATLFTTYGTIQHFVARAMNLEHSRELPILCDAISGGISGFAISIYATPLELIKCKLQARQERIRLSAGNLKKLSPLALTKFILEHRGISGLYYGFLATIMRDIPGYFCFFGGYKYAKLHLLDPDAPPNEIQPFRTMLAGSFAGILLWAISFPFDVIKSRIQIKNLEDGIIKLCLDIFKKEGFIGLYHGFWLTMMRAIPATAVLFTVVEYTELNLHRLCDNYLYS